MIIIHQKNERKKIQVSVVVHILLQRVPHIHHAFAALILFISIFRFICYVLVLVFFASLRQDQLECVVIGFFIRMRRGERIIYIFVASSN